MGMGGKAEAFSTEKAHRTQLELSKLIIFEDRLPKRIRLIAGVDVAYARGSSIGAVAVLDYSSLDLVESQVSLCRTRFPYIPTLLSFREVPPAMLCLGMLETQPDAFLVDGHGFAHPYHCGFASHLGLIIGKPTVGVAKNRLFGEVGQAETRENVAFLTHDKEIVGAAVTTKQGSRPVYVSVGHMISLDTAAKIVKECTRGNRIPVPLLKAHEVATAEKRKSHIASASN